MCYLRFTYNFQIIFIIFLSAGNSWSYAARNCQKSFSLLMTQEIMQVFPSKVFIPVPYNIRENPQDTALAFIFQSADVFERIAQEYLSTQGEQ